MASQYIWRLVKRVAYQANVRRIQCTCGSTTKSFHAPSCAQTSTGERMSEMSPHTLRRTFASDLINKGVRLEAISRLVGHSSTRVTEQAYAQLLTSTVKEEWWTAMGWAL
jgi:integrase